MSDEKNGWLNVVEPKFWDSILASLFIATVSSDGGKEDLVIF